MTTAAETTFGPDTVFEPPADGGTVEFWAEISATDATGVAVNKVQEGDTIRIVDISGICSFDGGGDRGRDDATSIVATAAEAIGGPWGVAIKLLRHIIPIILGGSCKRDGYGQEPGKTDYAEDEGGIIVCVPRSGGSGMIYSNDDTRPTSSKKDGRKSKVDYCHFPIRGVDNVFGIKHDGVLRIGAFDHKYEDNAGTYEVVFRITRPRSGA